MLLRDVMVGRLAAVLKHYLLETFALEFIS